MLLAADQGATITVNGGETWSSWYNQPTAQLYHVSTDNRFPYWVYGGQQESGSVGIASRGDDGSITFRDWHPVAAEEWGYVAPDPLDPDVVYGGKLTRFSHATKDAQDVSPEPVRTEKYRFLRTAPVVFSPADPRVLYYAGQLLFRTADGGRHWEVISPDLSREAPEVPPSVGVYRKPTVEASLKEKRRGVIYTVAPSPRDGSLIWAGTDDGLIHVTRDGGKSWANVTPPALTPWSKVSMLEASPFESWTAYAAVNRFRLDDLRPHVYRTRDFGKSWTEIASGLSPNAPVNAVRSDPVRKGLLYAATERGVSVSFDDGDSWMPLQINLPTTSVRDLVVHGDDLVVGTHGRSFWILDDVTPLRQLTPGVTAAHFHLFAPQTATRVRRSRNTDTPLPPEEPAGENPPDGAILTYWLGAKPQGPVTLEILSPHREVVRRYSSADMPRPDEADLRIASSWVRRPRILSAEPGLHRFVWDFRYPDPQAGEREHPISAIPGDTPRGPQGPLAVPGLYLVRLTVDGTAVEQPLKLRMDPRIETSGEGLEAQLALARRITALLARTGEAMTKARALPKTAKERTALVERLENLDRDLTTLYGVVESSDAAPTPQAVAAAADLEKALDAATSVPPRPSN